MMHVNLIIMTPLDLPEKLIVFEAAGYSPLLPRCERRKKGSAKCATNFIP